MKQVKDIVFIPRKCCVVVVVLVVLVLVAVVFVVVAVVFLVVVFQVGLFLLEFETRFASQ